MAEEIPVIRNKKLLIVALLLGVLVAVVFNVYVRGVRSAGKGEMIELVAFARSMRAGDRIKPGDLKPIQFPKQTKYLDGVGSVLEWSDRSIPKDRYLTQPVRKGEFFRFTHIAGDEGSLPSNAVTPGMITYTVTMDRNQTPGNILLPNSRVNVVGMFTIGGKTQAYIVIEKVRVLGVGGRGPSEAPGFRASQSSAPQSRRSYSSITIEVPSRVALQLDNLRTHAAGNFWVQVLNPSEVPTEGLRINTELRSLSESARLGRPRSVP